MIPSNYSRINHPPHIINNQYGSPAIELNRLTVSSKKLENINCIFGPSDKIGGLYLGDVVSTLKQDLLRGNNIRAILTCMCQRVSINPIVNCHKILPIRDILEYPIIQHFDDAVAWIDQKRKQKCNVLVHCHAGVSRSVTIVVAYLIRTQNWNPFQAFEFVRQQRQRAKPNASFWNQINEYYNYWSKNSAKQPNQIASNGTKENNSVIVHHLQPHKMTSEQILPKRTEFQSQIKKQEQIIERPFEQLHKTSTTNDKTQRTGEKNKQEKQKLSISRRRKIFQRPNFLKEQLQKTKKQQVISQYYINPSMINSSVKPYLNSHINHSSIMFDQSRFSQNKSTLNPRNSMHSESVMKSRPQQQSILISGRSSIQPQPRLPRQSNFVSPFQTRSIIRYP